MTGGRLSEETASEIVDAIPDEGVRAKFVRFVDLMRLLGDCVIASDYTISSGINDAIKLSAAGRALRDKVATAKVDKIPPKEAKLLCALAIGQAELFVDIESTNLEELASAIGEQIADGRIRFPFTFGREAYDSYAALFDEEQPVLTEAETQRFLDTLPVGVQQYGAYVTGPYGLRESASVRQVHSGRRLGAFHCSDPLCNVVHQVHLTTSASAAINSHREKFNEALDEDGSSARDWFGAADDIRDLPALMFHDTHVGVVAYLLGDALDVDELRLVVAHLFDETAGRLRAAVRDFLDVANATSTVSALDRAQLMQIALLAPEDALHAALDSLVMDEAIKIPDGEVRRPAVNRDRRSGAFGLMPELGRFGVRFVSQEEGFATLRLRNELVALTNTRDEAELAELRWQVRDIEGESLDEQLDTFFRVTDPSECIKRLVLPRRANVHRLAGELGVLHGLSADDDEITQRFLWKLGYPLADEKDPRAEFWRLHQKLSGLANAAHTPGARDTEEFLGTASKFFRELERYLAEALAFTSWALLHDHASDPNPYEFGLEADHARGMSFVQEAADDAGDPVKTFDFLDEKLDLYTLIRGFEFLAKRLESLGAQDPEDHVRPISQVPAFARASSLKRFPFESTVPFLNLTARSRTRLSTQLREVARSLLRGKVNEVRNEHQHYRKTASGVEQIESALREIEASMRVLEANGLALVEFALDDAVSDRWGRSEYYFAAPRGARHVVTRPSAYDWLGLPDLNEPQYVVPGAVFAEPNEVLRFRRRLDSRYTTLWRDFPSRRKKKNSALSQSGVEHPGSEMTSA